MMPKEKWFAVCVRSQQEHAVQTHLLHKRLEVFLPVYRTQRKWSDRVKHVEKPLFPGYLFCRFNIADRSTPVLTTPGVLRLLGTSTGPESVDEIEIRALQQIVASNLPAGPWPYVRAGTWVVVERGPLSGVEGLVETVKDQARLIVSMTLLGRSVFVDIDSHWVRPLSRPTVQSAAGMAMRVAV